MKKKLGVLISVVLIIGMTVAFTGCMDVDDEHLESSIIVDLEDKQSRDNYYDVVTIYKNHYQVLEDLNVLGNMEFEESKEFEVTPGTYTITVEAMIFPEGYPVYVWKTVVTVERGETVTADDWDEI